MRMGRVGPRPRSVPEPGLPMAQCRFSEAVLQYAPVGLQRQKRRTLAECSQHKSNKPPGAKHPPTLDQPAV